MTTIKQDGLTGLIQNELLRLGFKCRCYRLVWFTDKPIHKKSIKQERGPGGVILTEPYITSLGEKTALKFYEELKERIS